MKKKDLQEILDKDLNLIGNINEPDYDNNMASDANLTTDKQAVLTGQNFKDGLFGTFGFYFYEDSTTEEKPMIDDLAKLMYEHYHGILMYYGKNPVKLKEDILKHLKGGNVNYDNMSDKDYEWSQKIINTIKPYVEEVVSKQEVTEKLINDEVDNSIITRKKETEDNFKLKKVAELLNRELKDSEIDKLIKILENEQ